MEQELGDYQIRPDQDRKFKCGIVKVGKYFNKICGEQTISRHSNDVIMGLLY